ncbi:YndJ-like protein [Virgibacillus subterraneus]|uniref:YndJ-like protein n=1 Tax=Virgibacillus subterraneus TaxID=621109 RepID=A0A1H9HSE7_9BACI|nr:YndJ family protein [Virgibacillus subterraneus]SEQ65172.1 YndJ-like protein [Virgibacillus subterraneus]
MTFRNIGLCNILIVLVIAIIGPHPWYFMMLTVAQLIYLPLTLHLVMESDNGYIPRYLPYLAIPAFAAVIFLQITNDTAWDTIFAVIYFLFTLFIAGYGFSRFLHRGFIHLEEFLIDIGLIYIAIGGGWFVAYEANIDTGFSPMMTWLTGIHFHYSAFLLPVFTGLLGRLYKSALYRLAGIIVIVSPIIVALGITFSTSLELLSVIIYIIGIYGLVYISFKASINWLNRASYAALGVAIIFSLVYAFGNVTGLYTVTINFMLLFHGVTNSILFAAAGIIGWYAQLPFTRMQRLSFPVSRIRGKGVIGEAILADRTDHKTYKGLVDDMSVYEGDINTDTLSPDIIDFYENTNRYRLIAEVKWRAWFKPFAAVYRLISRYVRQVNLPFSSKKVEMSGNIFSVKDDADGRNEVRAWVRKINKETTFVALYSSHEELGRSYMNIALPLPYASMVGVLELTQYEEALQLSSTNKDNNSGIYLTFGKYLFRLPIEEQFYVKEVETGILRAQHNMWIFSLPFLKINYDIYHQDLVKHQ